MRKLTFRDIVVTPTAAVLQRPEPYEFKGGPVWPDFAAQIEARHLRDREPVPFDTRPDTPPSVAAALPEAAWCGPVCRHFGHAIADFSMRIAASAHLLPGVPLLFSAEPDGDGAIPGFFWGILDQFAVARERVVLLREPARVAALHVFPQAERLNGPPPERDYLDLLDRAARRQADPSLAGAAVFVSRSLYRPDSMMGRIAGEAYLDRALAAAGVIVVHPETIPLDDQLRLYQNAGRLLFSEGSALHALQLLGRIPGKVGVLMRRPKGRMAAGAVSRRAEAAWIGPLSGHIRGTRRDGRGPEISNGVTVLDPGALIDALGAGMGIHLAPYWDTAIYREACVADVRRWIDYRKARRRRLGVPPGDLEEIAASLRGTALLGGALEGYPLA